MGDPIELVNAAENDNGRRGGTIYEALSNDRTQNGEYMTIGTVIEGETGKHLSDQEGTYKKLDEIRKKLSDLSKYLNILKIDFYYSYYYRSYNVSHFWSTDTQNGKFQLLITNL